MSNGRTTATNYDGLWGRQIKAEVERKRRMKDPTPRPWKWLPKEGQFIVDADRQIIAEIPCQGANPADGAFIVKAVNERDALLQEVSRLRELLKPIIDCYGLGQSAEKFTEQVGPLILDAHAALSGKER